jgi:multidrug resistance protein, MATE family
MVNKIVVGSTIQLEVREFLKLAIPLASAQVAQSAVGFVDTIMMGRLGAESLAAGGLAALNFQFLLTVVSGIVMAVSPLVAEAYGAGQNSKIEQIARQGLWLSLLLGLPLMLVIGNLDAVLRFFQQPDPIPELADRYFDFILWGTFPALGFAMLRAYVSALSQAYIVTVIVLIGTLCNIVGNYVLGFGKFGFPRMELAGLGLSSGLSYWIMFLIFLIYILRHPQLKHYNFLRNFHLLHPKMLQRLIMIGSAIAITITLEYGLFAIVTFLMGILGTEVLAAYQTVYQTMYIIFMVPLGMSFAVTARVGQWFGQHNLAAARQAGYVSITLAAAFMGGMAIAVLLNLRPIIGLYLDIQNPANANVLALAIPMLIISALAQLLDGVQRVSMGALHGLQDTRIPMLLSGLTFWGVGLTTGYLLGFPLQLGGVGLLIGQSIGVAVAGIIFAWRFYTLTAEKG